MEIKLDKKKGESLYIQLYDAISIEIMIGRLRNGMKLPTRRTLAEELGVAQTTVDSAYKMLQDTGYIISIPRHGYVVSFKEKLYEDDIPWETDAAEEIVMSPNGIDTSRFPRASYSKILKDILYNDGLDIFSYTEKGGEFALRNEISKYLYSFRNIKCPPFRIIIGAGMDYLLSALSAIFPRNTVFTAENPGNTHFYHTMSAYKYNVKLLPLNIDEFDIDALYASEASVLWIEPDARFPRSRSMSEDTRRAILEWAYAAPDRYIIENGYDSELQRVSFETLYSMDEHDRVIYLNSFSRTLCPAITTSYMLLPEKLLEQWKKVHTYYYALSPKQEQFALAEFIGRGYFTKYRKLMKKIYKEKCDYLTDNLKSAFGDDICIYGNDGSTYIAVELASHSADDMKLLARQNGVKLFSMNSFNVHKKAASPEKDRLVIGVGDLSCEKINRGVRLMATGVKNRHI